MDKGQMVWQRIPTLLLGLGLGLLLATMTGGCDRGRAAVVALPESKPNGGFAYEHKVVPDVPWSIHIVKLEINNPQLNFYTTLGHGNTLGMGTVSDQLRTLPQELGQPLAAINGDFYSNHRIYQGRPRDLQIRQGEVLSSPAGHTCFWLGADGRPHMTNVYSRFQLIWPNGKTIPFGLNEDREDDAAVLYTSVVGSATYPGRGIELLLERPTKGAWLPLHMGRTYAARVRTVRTSGGTPITAETAVLSIGLRLYSRLPAIQPGATLQINTESVPSLTGATVAIGGGPTLVRDGKTLPLSGLIRWRHPRTALGWNKDHLFLVEVDGRQYGLSVGMTFQELADFMVKLGCDEAMNLDGGGSATLWALGRVRNSPSEGRERPSANALVVLQKTPTSN
jgi:large repetitive protein